MAWPDCKGGSASVSSSKLGWSNDACSAENRYPSSFLYHSCIFLRCIFVPPTQTSENMHKFSAGQAAPKVQYSFEHVSTWFTVESNDQDNPLVWRVTTQLCDVSVALQLGQWEGHDLGTSFQEILA